MAWFAGLLGLAAILGCGSPAEMTLVQPQLGGLQQRLDLASAQAWWAREAGIDRYLAQFPLPGATTGRPTYVVYLRLPADLANVAVLPPTAGSPDAPAARGFLIQTRGELAGLVALSAGRVAVSQPLFGGDDARRIQFVVQCEDGSELSGQIVGQRNDFVLRQFEARRAADMTDLQPPVAQ